MHGFILLRIYLFAVLYVICLFLHTPYALSASDYDDGTSNAYKVCMDNSGGVTVDMIECITTEIKRLEAVIISEYNKLSSSVASERNEQLQNAVTAWKKYRKEMSSLIYDPDGGSAARISANSWMLQETARLAQTLKSMNE